MSMTAEVRTVAVGRQRLKVAIRPGQNEPGRPSRVPLLLINGIGANLELLEPFVTAVDPAVEVIRFDPPGIGGSPLPARPYWFSGLCRLIAGMLTELGYDQVDVLGISWGGGVAQHFAAFQPARCRRLVLVATATGTMMLPGRPSVLVHLLTPRRYLDREYLQRVAGDIYGGLTRIDSEEIAAAMHHHNRTGLSRGYLYQLAASAGWTSVAFLPRLRQSTLIVAGDDDPIIPLANARLMNLLIPKARLHVYHGGHLGLVTEAAGLAPVVDAFLAAPLPFGRFVIPTRAPARSTRWSSAASSPGPARSGKRAAAAQPSRWPSVSMAPHSGHTRWAQQAASPPSSSVGWRRTWARTAAWLSSTSRVAVSRVTGRAAASARSLPSSARCTRPESSSRYRRRNSSNLAGSCPYHRRSSVDGAASLAHSSSRAASLRRPRGQTRSTSTRAPSSGDGAS
jgi:poly(3-hydroxyalkanoate) depolymerase